MDCVNCQALIGILHGDKTDAGNKGVGEVSIPNRDLHLLKHLQAVLFSQTLIIADEGKNVKNHFLSNWQPLKLGFMSGVEKNRWFSHTLLICYNERCCDPQGELPMSQQNLDPDKLRHLPCGLTTDLSKFRQRHEYQQIVTIIDDQQTQIQYLEAENSDLRSEIDYLRTINRDLKYENRELKCQANPFSQDGDAICNSTFTE